MWNNNKGSSQGFFPAWMRATMGPLLLMMVTLPLAFVLVNAMDPAAGRKGDLIFNMGSALLSSPVATIQGAFRTPSAATVQILAVFAAIQLAMMKLIPGKEFTGPVTATGHVPVYNANGMQCYIITVFGYLLFSTYGLAPLLPTWARYSPDVLYTHYPELISFMSIFAFVFCIGLYLKGIYAPTSTDYGSSGNPVADFWWGTELYPRVLGWDVKMFTNCRFGMMMWALLPISYACHDAAQPGGLSNAMAVNLVLNLVYVAKFFWWESGYLRTIDIMHDRAGYYICWGCLVWVPSVYVSHSYFLVTQRDVGSFNLARDDFTFAQAAVLTLVGVLCVLVNYDADRQRAYVRAMDGKCDVWGSPAKIIRAKYEVELANGKKDVRNSLLLASGWWGLARHFHYVPEILAAFCWSLPAGLHTLSTPSSLLWFIPFFYVIFLTILLLDRAFRDSARCESKYGKYYEEYKRLVPKFIIPGVL
jgi:7-dehydrocholesterol reductase